MRIKLYTNMLPVLFFGSLFLVVPFTASAQCAPPLDIECDLGSTYCDGKTFGDKLTSACQPPKSGEATPKTGIMGKPCTDVDTSTVGGGKGKCIKACTCKGETDTEGNPLMDPMMMPMMGGGMPPMLPMLPMPMKGGGGAPMQPLDEKPCSPSILGSFLSRHECDKNASTTPLGSKSLLDQVGGVIERLTTPVNSASSSFESPIKIDAAFLSTTTGGVRPLRSETTVQASPTTFGGSTFQAGGTVQTPPNQNSFVSNVLSNITTSLSTLLSTLRTTPPSDTQTPSVIGGILNNIRTILGNLFSTQ